MTVCERLNERSRWTRYAPALLSLAALLGAFILTAPAATATGGSRHCDLNGDGFDDAAIGVPWDRVGSVPGAGAVNVIYGSADGLTAVGSQRWTQNSPGIPNRAEEDDHFGWRVECGDFNGDGYADLVVGAPGESIGGTRRAGAFHVLFGSAAGLDSADSLFLHRDKPGVAGTLGSDVFAISLGVGDFNGDGRDDLAVGAIEQFRDRGGSVQVFPGSVNGLSLSEDRIWHRNREGIKGKPASSDDVFGYTLAPDDFNGDGYDDIAIGVIGDTINDLSQAGSVNVIYGSPGGLTAAGDQWFHRDQPGMKGPAEIQFGRDLAGGDFDGDGFGDLAIGVGDRLDGSGSVHTLRGTADGLTRKGDQIWHRDMPGIKGTVDPAADFGWPLTTGRFNNDDYDDLAIGVGWAPNGAGSVHIIYGNGTGLTAAGDQIWHQDRKGIKGRNEERDGFGQSIGSADFDGNGVDDLLIGVSGEGDATGSWGRVGVIYGTRDGLSADGNQSWSQRTQGIPGASEYGDHFGSVSG